jgi:hypothetical protein
MAVVRLKAYEEFFEFITSNPTLQEIADFHHSDVTNARIQELLEINQQRRLTTDEEEELNEYERLEYIIQGVKVRAFEKLDGMI